MDTENYTVGQLIESLSEIESIEKQIEQIKNQRPEGDEAQKFLIAIVDSGIVQELSFNAKKSWQQIPDDAIDILSPICEADGAFDAGALKQLRGKLCISLRVGKSVVDEMIITEFAEKLHGNRPQGGEGNSDPLMTTNEKAVWNTLSGKSLTLDGLEREMNLSRGTINKIVGPGSKFRKEKLVVNNHDGNGYYRPDAPPK